MDRRDFMRLSAVTTAGGLVLSKDVLAEVSAMPSAAGGIYFTKEAPGRWKGKEAGHLPSIDIAKVDGNLTVSVVTAHEMKAYEHYIVKHVLLDKNFQYLDEHLFDPTKDKVAMSSFILKQNSGTVYALSMCNKHDMWLSSVIV